MSTVTTEQAEPTDTNEQSLVATGAAAAAAAATAGQQQQQPSEGNSNSSSSSSSSNHHQQQQSYIPSSAGSVIEASNGFGGTVLIRIQNIASTADLGVRLDLKKIALKCRNTEFNPRRFGAVIMRLREPRATALIFSSGKMCVTGVKSTHNVHLACKKFHYW